MNCDKKNIAVVIPAYKIDFFELTLESFSNQTCKDFTLYIGEDCSKSDFKSIVDRYKDMVDIVYHRFDTNLGGSNLVGQWRRCIDLTKNETWLWLFSDDDIVGTDCVKNFYDEIYHTNEVYDLYHFDVEIISDCGNLIKKARRFPSVIRIDKFYKSKASAKLDSFVVEYIFSRQIYENTGGFEYFDLAWGSDIATWVKMGAEKGIKTISGDCVHWRKSEKNITPNLENEIVVRKLNTDIKFLCWINCFFDSADIIRFNKFVFFRLIFFYSLILMPQQLHGLLDNAEINNIITKRQVYFYKKTYLIIKMAKIIKSKIGLCILKLLFASAYLVVALSCL